MSNNYFDNGSFHFQESILKVKTVFIDFSYKYHKTLWKKMKSKRTIEVVTDLVNYVIYSLEHLY